MSLKNRYDYVIIRNNLSLGLSHNALDYVLKLEKENELLNHYKLLYQKVKDRNDKAIDFLENHRSGSDWYDTRDLLDILKGNNE